MVPDIEVGMHPSENAFVPGGCETACFGVMEYYNTTRLHSSMGYIAPCDKLNGREQEIFAIWDARLHEARDRRRKNRLMQFEVVKEQKPVLNESVMNGDSAQVYAQAM